LSECHRRIEIVAWQLAKPEVLLLLSLLTSEVKSSIIMLLFISYFIITTKQAASQQVINCCLQGRRRTGTLTLLRLGTGQLVAMMLLATTRSSDVLAGWSPLNSTIQQCNKNQMQQRSNAILVVNYSK
jgi:hypothetical protein